VISPLEQTTEHKMNNTIEPGVKAKLEIVAKLMAKSRETESRAIGILAEAIGLPEDGASEMIANCDVGAGGVTEWSAAISKQVGALMIEERIAALREELKRMSSSDNA
jgi:hypothetical protein